MAYIKSLEINPNNPKNLNRLASVYLIIGDLNEASLTQRKALNIEPNNTVLNNKWKQ